MAGSSTVSLLPAQEGGEVANEVTRVSTSYVEVSCHFLRAEMYSLKTGLSVLALPFIYCTDLDKWLILSEFLSLSMKWLQYWPLTRLPLTVSENYNNNSEKANDVEYNDQKLRCWICLRHCWKGFSEMWANVCEHNFKIMKVFYF